MKRVIIACIASLGFLGIASAVTMCPVNFQFNDVGYWSATSPITVTLHEYNCATSTDSVVFTKSYSNNPTETAAKQLSAAKFSAPCSTSEDQMFYLEMTYTYQGNYGPYYTVPSSNIGGVTFSIPNSVSGGQGWGGNPPNMKQFCPSS